MSKKKRNNGRAERGGFGNSEVTHRVWRLFEQKVDDTSLCAVLQANRGLQYGCPIGWGVLHLLEDALGHHTVRRVCPLALAASTVEQLCGQASLLPIEESGALVNEYVRELWRKFAVKQCKRIADLWPREREKIQAAMKETLWLLIQGRMNKQKSAKLLEYLVLRYGLEADGPAPIMKSTEVAMRMYSENQWTFNGNLLVGETETLFSYPYVQRVLGLMASTLLRRRKINQGRDISMWPAIAEKVGERMDAEKIQVFNLSWSVAQLMGPDKGNVRIANALEGKGIREVRNLVACSQDDLIEEVGNFAKDSAHYVALKLMERGLRFGMSEEEIRQYELGLRQEREQQLESTLIGEDSRQ